MFSTRIMQSSFALEFYYLCRGAQPPLLPPPTTAQSRINVYRLAMVIHWRGVIRLEDITATTPRKTTREKCHLTKVPKPPACMQVGSYVILNNKVLLTVLSFSYTKCLSFSIVGSPTLLFTTLILTSTTEAFCNLKTLKCAHTLCSVI